MAKTSKTPATLEPLAADEKEYVVTDKAPSKVAGRRVEPNDRLTLTDDQARFEEISGHIVLAPASAAPKVD